MMIAKYYLCVSFSALLLCSTGCGMPTGRHELLPPSLALPPLPAKAPDQIVVYKEGVRPQRGCIRIARLTAKGDPYTSREQLEETLRKEAASLGAEFVLLTREIVTDNSVGPHFVEYGAGIPMAEQFKTPILFGLACREAKIWLGIEISKDWTVTSVAPHSAADRIGLKVGDRLWSINDNYLPDFPFTYDRDVLSKAPGERVNIEYRTQNGQKVNRDVILEARPHAPLAEKNQ